MRAFTCASSDSPNTRSVSYRPGWEDMHGTTGIHQAFSRWRAETRTARRGCLRAVSCVVEVDRSGYSRSSSSSMSGISPRQVTLCCSMIAMACLCLVAASMLPAAFLDSSLIRRSCSPLHDPAAPPLRSLQALRRSIGSSIHQGLFLNEHLPSDFGGPAGEALQQADGGFHERCVRGSGLVLG